MGRGRGRGRGGGGGRGRGRGGNTEHYVTALDKSNPDFEEYYKAQNIVPEGEWDEFIASLRKPLPVTFRINGSGKFADHLRDKLQSDFFSHFSDGTLQLDGEQLQPPRPLPWYPANYAWHMDFSRGQLRKLPLLADIHAFLVKANDNGSISRQEAVSMVPPLFLDVQPHHKVLDMCAAPGSKTFQLLEALHSGGAGSPAAGGDPTAAPSAAAVAAANSGPGGLPPGFVVANDADFQRCNLLTHQTKRVCSPNLMVTNHSAEHFPELKGLDGKPVRFDRILCDVPCSGDGTIRKAPDIWRRWGVGGGNGLHIMQLRIALQGCRLLEVGGRMVYSTCTFNPIEDEAVVAALLATCGGAMELVDVSNQLPKLRRLPGKHEWKVRDRQRWYTNWEEAKAAGARLDPSMFPSPEAKSMPLERCMRFLPHHQDTGGFFVVVLRKVRELPAFELPTAYRPSQAEGAGGGGGEGRRDKPAINIEDPIAYAKDAAAAALAAAEAAIKALGEGDVGAVNRSNREASAAAGMAQAALDAQKQQQRKAAKTAAGQGPQQAAAAAACPGAAADAEAAAGEGMDLDGEDAGADAAMGGADDGDEAAAAAAAAAAKEESEDEGDAAGGPPKAGAGPSWVRGGGSRGRAEGGRHKHIDPVAPVEDPDILQPLVEYYGLAPDFPLSSQLVARSLEAARPKRLYFVAQPLMDVMVADAQESLKIISVGLKVFERQEIREGDSPDSCCSYRIAQEGLPLILPHLTKQRVQSGRPEFIELLRDRYLMLPHPNAAQASAPQANGAEPAAAEASAAAPAEGGAGWKPGSGKAAKEANAGQRKPPIADAELIRQVDGVKGGCVVVELRQADAEALGLVTGSETAGALTAYAPMALSAWKGKASLAIMVDKAETLQMIDKIEAAKKRQQQGGQ